MPFESQTLIACHCKALSSITPNCPAPQIHLPWTLCLSDSNVPHTYPTPSKNTLTALLHLAGGSAILGPEPQAGDVTPPPPGNPSILHVPKWFAEQPAGLDASQEAGWELTLAYRAHITA